MSASDDPYDLFRFLRPVADFPKPGILFQDVSPILSDPDVWVRTVDALAVKVADLGTEVVAGIEARGFLIGAAVAYRLGLGFVPIRKPGKLPAAVEVAFYNLEYGTDSLEMHLDAPINGRNVAIVDDVLASGGTAAAAKLLVDRLGGETCGFAFIIELEQLAGRAALTPERVESLLTIS
jgi:adenine phosphoribosyltransferase